MEINDEKVTQLIMKCNLQKNRKGSGQDIRPRRITKMVHVFNMQQDREQTA
jgi:hypothetical protein